MLDGGIWKLKQVNAGLTVQIMYDFSSTEEIPLLLSIY